ncbi:hypothetical protein CAFE_16810 [Caprobacter fermentans]|uniref:DUF4830 domain-containing protein n=1 Tax=Caproicibacter fermentans TaxID=2576756 RepID=A0A6N8HZ47_9FIRM|nr:DUF4830 domain-containing protein [Caproicibacter fermentans]MVB10979.1 hypothetical protein [Caproicibacter fermentans]OCN01682.1 hypothetical protein A7X67_00890 [Clostridium sp. W14A]QNK39404.1 DUF4830 domain-containing protein [Caproicibacter fermentans]
MFVISVKTGKRKTIAVLAAVLLVVTAAIVAVKLNNSAPEADNSGKKYSLAASTNEERIAFFKQFGWEVKPQSVSDGEVTIPQTFDDVYTKYNNIQQEQGLDLTPYAGKTCKQWVYEITNFPEQEIMRGTLLVYDGKVVGGDLCTPALDGFMTGFDGQLDSNDYGVNEPTLARGTDDALTMAPARTVSSEVEEAQSKASSEIPANAWPTD